MNVLLWNLEKKIHFKILILCFNLSNIYSHISNISIYSIYIQYYDHDYLSKYYFLNQLTINSLFIKINNKIKLIFLLIMRYNLDGFKILKILYFINN